MRCTSAIVAGSGWAVMAQHMRDELRRVAKALRRWRTQILNHHTTGASNGPVEAANLLIKQVRRLSVNRRRVSADSSSRGTL